MIIEEDTKLDFSDVLIRPKRSTLKSRKQVNLFRTMDFRNAKGHDRRFYGIPIIASNMDGVGTMEIADILASERMFSCLVKTYNTNELVEYFDADVLGQDAFDIYPMRTEHVAMCIGATEEEYLKFRDVYELTDGKIKYLCVDVANGYTEMFSNFIYNIRSNHPELVIIAGNVVTADMTQELILNGADIIKVGIGPGSVCTTRVHTGIGYPQLSAIIECADAAHGLGGHIIADGGCTTSGDIAKAFGGGADFVMLGGMLAGHDEGGGEIISTEHITSEIKNVNRGSPLFVEGQEAHRETKKRQMIHFYGMSSTIANDKHFGGLKDYRASEGKEVMIPYKGPIKDTIQHILGGLRSTCTYVGAKQIKHLTKCTTFVKVNKTHNTIFGDSNGR